MFLPIYAKQATDAARALWKVPREKTPGSGKWMTLTDKLVHKFERSWGEYYGDAEKRHAFICEQCGRENAFPSKYLNAPKASR
eukprot:10075168-Karenia_brevis.AAC.1